MAFLLARNSSVEEGGVGPSGAPAARNHWRTRLSKVDCAGGKPSLLFPLGQGRSRSLKPPRPYSRRTAVSFYLSLLIPDTENSVRYSKKLGLSRCALDAAPRDVPN